MGFYANWSQSLTFRPRYLLRVCSSISTSVFFCLVPLLFVSMDYCLNLSLTNSQYSEFINTLFIGFLLFIYPAKLPLWIVRIVRNDTGARKVNRYQVNTPLSLMTSNDPSRTSNNSSNFLTTNLVISFLWALPSFSSKGNKKSIWWEFTHIAAIHSTNVLASTNPSRVTCGPQCWLVRETCGEKVFPNTHSY